MKTKENNSDLNEIVFGGKNKEYGSYVLRKLYSKYITLSAMGASILFSLIVSLPLIADFFVQGENNNQVSGKVKVVTFENIVT